MVGLGDLTELLRSMEPVLHDAPYGFGLTQGADWVAGAFAMVAEDEGMTVVATEVVLVAAGVAHQGGWARISLTVHSDLAAVGLTAAISAALTAEGISANMVAGYHHDHVFVPWVLRHDAVAAMQGVSNV
ncbi:ACT domain-containing protein [Pseudorhodobacter ferrugineus]|uniref:ACT domain-containing protein n=1 Tax=Pseudorhodobacter ferrugineus TaxID=77008 RepID=UPI0003B3EBBF|nr:ACT domain-containing protein [Pseudorhodobacter ferrugineus]